MRIKWLAFTFLLGLVVVLDPTQIPAQPQPGQKGGKGSGKGRDGGGFGGGQFPGAGGATGGFPGAPPTGVPNAGGPQHLQLSQALSHAAETVLVREAAPAG